MKISFKITPLLPQIEYEYENQRKEDKPKLASGNLSKAYHLIFVYIYIVVFFNFTCNWIYKFIHFYFSFVIFLSMLWSLLCDCDEVGHVDFRILWFKPEPFLDQLLSRYSDENIIFVFKDLIE